MKLLKSAGFAGLVLGLFALTYEQRQLEQILHSISRVFQSNNGNSAS
jgi:hypothetical protein